MLAVPVKNAISSLDLKQAITSYLQSNFSRETAADAAPSLSEAQARHPFTRTRVHEEPAPSFLVVPECCLSSHPLVWHAGAAQSHDRLQRVTGRAPEQHDRVRSSVVSGPRPLSLRVMPLSRSLQHDGTDAFPPSEHLMMHHRSWSGSQTYIFMQCYAFVWDAYC